MERYCVKRRFQNMSRAYCTGTRRGEADQRGPCLHLFLLKQQKTMIRGSEPSMSCKMNQISARQSLRPSSCAPDAMLWLCFHVSAFHPLYIHGRDCLTARL